MEGQVTLRARIHAAIDEILDEYEGQPVLPHVMATTTAPPPDFTIESLGPVDPFSYSWPADYGTEEFRSGAAYRIPGTNPGASVIVAWTTRLAWGRDRDRAVVFYKARPDDGVGRWYPWTEFVETDTGMYAATIPNPDRPRSILRDGSAIPAEIARYTIARADQLFNSIREGASLRLVLEQDDEIDMVRHGYRVAQLRGRV
jgi:hypothetical protein